MHTIHDFHRSSTRPPLPKPPPGPPAVEGSAPSNETHGLQIWVMRIPSGGALRGYRQWPSVTISDHQWPSVTCSQQLWILQGSVCCFMGAQKFKRQEFHFPIGGASCKAVGANMCQYQFDAVCSKISGLVSTGLGFLVLICTQTCTVIIDNYSLYIWSMRLWEGAQRLETSRRNKDSALPKKSLVSDSLCRCERVVISIDSAWSY